MVGFVCCWCLFCVNIFKLTTRAQSIYREVYGCMIHCQLKALQKISTYCI